MASPPENQSVYHLLSKHCVYASGVYGQNKFPFTHGRTFWKTLGFPSVSAAELPKVSDKVLNAPENYSFISEVEIQEYLKNETGMDRLRRLFSRNESGKWNPELMQYISLTSNVAVITFVCMSLISGRHARNEWIAKNKATAFKTRFLASRSLQDAVTMRSLKEGGLWTLKISSYCFVFFLSSKSISAYRNKSSPWHYILALGLTSSLFKFSLGPKGMFAGGVVGLAIGLVPGFLMYWLEKAMNETEEQKHYWSVMKMLEYQKSVRGELRSPVTGEQIQPKPLL